MSGVTWKALFGLAPPRQSTAPERLAEIAAQQRERLAALNPDAVVIYDIQDESDRNAAPRPFPFLPTVDPSHWAEEALAGVAAPRITYKSVPSQNAEALTRWLAGRTGAAVLVGAPSKHAGGLSLTDAYALARTHAPALSLGGVAIPERHHRAFDEHRRIIAKSAQGCRFFVTQAVYDVHGSLSVLSDYALELAATGGTPAPIFFTFAPCGSQKTVEFMKWLGVSFPRWLENELRTASDILERSQRLCERNFRELVAFAREKKLPIGFNVESVSIRKAEIEAATALFRSLREIVS
jgi:5,10-methylenetetrahydrofolate reductase